MQRFLQRLTRAAALGWLALALSSPVFAQCSMCKESAKYQREEAITALKKGIVLLAVPPVGIVAGIGWAAYRNRNTFLGSGG